MTPAGLVVAPTQVAFDAYQGHELPPAKEVQLTALNGSPANYTASVS